MKNTTIKLFAAAAALLTPMISSVIAEEKKGFYTTISAGISNPKEDSENEVLPVIAGVISEVFETEYDPFKIESDSGLKLEAGIGYDFGKSRIEVTYDNSKSEMNTLDLSSLGFDDLSDIRLNGGERSTKSIMVSGFYDIDTDSKFTPYIGGGLGIAFIDTDSWSINEEDFIPIVFPSTDQQVFSWQLQAGLAYEINERVDLTTDLTYKDTSDFNIGIMSVKPSALISFEAGLRFYF